MLEALEDKRKLEMVLQRKPVELTELQPDKYDRDDWVLFQIAVRLRISPTTRDRRSQSQIS